MPTTEASRATAIADPIVDDVGAAPEAGLPLPVPRVVQLFAAEFRTAFRECCGRLRLERGSKVEVAACAAGYRSRSAFSRALANVMDELPGPAGQRLRKRSRETI